MILSPTGRNVKYVDKKNNVFLLINRVFEFNKKDYNLKNILIIKIN
jgi:hypothetical protein